jgi:hypothetical protein
MCLESFVGPRSRQDSIGDNPTRSSRLLVVGRTTIVSPRKPQPNLH